VDKGRLRIEIDGGALAYVQASGKVRAPLGATCWVLDRLAGEFQAAVKLGEAADIITAHPVALQLRTLQTMAEATKKNSTLIFPRNS
jgi:hypothetical protein